MVRCHWTAGLASHTGDQSCFTGHPQAVCSAGEWPRAVLSALKTAGRICMAWLGLLSPERWAGRLKRRRAGPSHSAAVHADSSQEMEPLVKRKKR